MREREREGATESVGGRKRTGIEIWIWERWGSWQSPNGAAGTTAKRFDHNFILVLGIVAIFAN